MSTTILPDSAPAASAAKDDRKILDLTTKDTPLARLLTDDQRENYLRHLCDDWTHLHGGLHQWREKMKKWEHMSEMNYTDRVGRPDQNNPEPVLDVFSYQNDTLGMSEGFVDFAAAQAKDDIFGNRPWLAATPEGKSDTTLADLITKHAQWKLNDSDIEPAILDGIRTACWGGTAFLKSRYHRETETFQKEDKPAAFSKSTGNPFLSPTGDLIFTEEELIALQVDGNDVEWKDQSTEETVTVYDNTRTDLLDYRDVAFKATARTLDLAFTPFYTKFRMGIQDVIAFYKIPKERHKELEFALVGSNEEARQERGESNVKPIGDDPFLSNQEISLVEGYDRYDPTGKGSPIRIHSIFSPTLQILFALDYLANETPAGKLPVFPVRVGKIPRRVFGVGYFEKYENANNAVDRQLNAITYRNKLGANVITGIHTSALENPQDKSFTIDSRKPVELKEEKKLTDFIEFATFPDMNSRSVELLNMHMQMPQMRSGITSAAQGELKGVPNASTATGVNQLTSRGALLLKDPISQMTSDIQPLVEFNVHLLYANLNRDETFTWGEGADAELLAIKAGDVQGLKMNVSLKLVQSQNQAKLANAQAAISIGASYAQLPETEKAGQRPLYVQAIASLGFNQAEDIIRQSTADPAGILAIVPPDVAPIIQQALIQAGLMADPTADPEETGEPATAPAATAAEESGDPPSAPVSAGG